MSESNDRIKGKADVFSFVLDALEGMRKNRQERTGGEIMDMIERYVNTPVRVPASNAYHAGVAEGVQHFCSYFVQREENITSDALHHIHNAVEEQWEELFRQLPSAGSTMTLAEMWIANEKGV